MTHFVESSCTRFTLVVKLTQTVVGEKDGRANYKIIGNVWVHYRCNKKENRIRLI